MRRMAPATTGLLVVPSQLSVSIPQPSSLTSQLTIPAVNFDIPESLSSSLCRLVFLLPEHDQLETSAYELGGDMTFEFKYLSDVATKETTYATAPSADNSLNVVKLVPGTATTISERQGCNAGKTTSFSMSPVGDSYINFFEDSNPCREYPSFISSSVHH